MKRNTLLLSLAVAWALVGSGCGLQNLKETNRRLKESNDRLISENNRLEEELASAQRRGTTAPELTAVPAPAVARAQDPSPALSTALTDDLLLDGVEVERTDKGLQFRIPDRVFFALGQATISQRGQKVLEKVAAVINKESPNKLVRVEGHTDDTPIRKVRNLYPTNWELSSARACTVVRFLVEQCNVNARRIYPAGFSYYRPLANGRSATSKSQNRRVEITILDETI